jgi:hypothetical protein
VCTKNFTMRRISTPLLFLVVVLLDSFGTSFLVTPPCAVRVVRSSRVGDTRSTPMATPGVVLSRSIITWGSSTALHVAPYRFETIRSLDSRLEKLEVAAPDILGDFYEPHLKSFSVVPGSVNVSTMCISENIYLAGSSTKSQGEEREQQLTILAHHPNTCGKYLALTHHVSGNRD